jgi:ribosomal peptide maturation radical SAM protein 1
MSTNLLPILNSSRIPASQPALSAEHLKLALVCMPWGGVAIPSLAMGVLKQLAKSVGCNADLHYFNISFARQIGLDLYHSISKQALVAAEWYFAQRLFGSAGTHELDITWEALKQNPKAHSMVEHLTNSALGSEQTCKQLAEREVDVFIDSCMQTVDWTQYDLVGFTTTFAQSLSSLLLAKRIKEASPSTRIAFGGANVESEMGVEFIQAFEWVDFVVHGEAELTFPALLRSMAEGQVETPIPGISMRHKNSVVRGDLSPRQQVNINLDSPVPDYTEYVKAIKDSGFLNRFGLTLYYESSRGCWWGQAQHCTFCGLNGDTMAFRKKDAARVFDEIMEISNKYRCFNVVSADNILATEYFKDLLPRIAESNVDLKLFYEVKANLKRTQVEALAKAGVIKIQPGIESFSSRLLKLMNKGITAIQNIQLLKWCKEYGIHPAWNILYGFPGELPSDYSNLPSHLGLLFHLTPPSATNQVMFERFSPYHFARDKYDLQLRPVDQYVFVYPPQRVDLSRIAYFFEGQWTGQICDPSTYMKDSIDQVARWKKHHASSEVYCSYSRGAGYMTIFDNRPSEPGAMLRMRQYHLEGPVADMYEYCDENRSLRAIHARIAERYAGYSLHELEQALSYLVSRGLLFEEGNRYLALATRGRPQYATWE